MNKKTILIGGLIVAVMAIGWAYAPARVSGRTVATTGECLATAPKDRTAITLRVRALDRNAANSMRTATQLMAQITEYLRTIENVEMQTTRMDSWERTDWSPRENRSITVGIETNVAVEISSEDSEIIDRILTRFAGMDNIFLENLRMFTSAAKMKTVMQDCLGDAIENARIRANAIARADRSRVGRLVNAEHITGGGGHHMMPRPMMAGRMMAETQPAFDMGGGLVSRDTEVSVIVNAVFEIR